MNNYVILLVVTLISSCTQANKEACCDNKDSIYEKKFMLTNTLCINLGLHFA